MILKSAALIASTLAAQTDLSLFTQDSGVPEGCAPLPTEQQWSRMSRRQKYEYVRSVRAADEEGRVCYPNALTLWQLKNVRGICMVIPQIECRNSPDAIWKPNNNRLSEDNHFDTSSYDWCCGADEQNCQLNQAICESIITQTQGIAPNIPRLPDMFQRTTQGVVSAHAELDEPDMTVNLNDVSNILLLPRGLTYHMFVQVWGEHLEDFRSASNCPPGGCTVLFPIQPLTNYGCWCNLASGDLTKGNGQPQDSFDVVCRDFQLCLRCARWDGKQGGYGCNPVSDGYMSKSGPDFIARCGEANPGNDCGRDLCMCYSQFYASLIGFLWNPPSAPYSPSRQHPGNLFNPSGTFDWDAECAGSGTGAADMNCCGNYPTRFPYNTDKKGCCGDQIFNPFVKCCDGDDQTGDIKDIGTC